MYDDYLLSSLRPLMSLMRGPFTGALSYREKNPNAIPPQPFHSRPFFFFSFSNPPTSPPLLFFIIFLNIYFCLGRKKKKKKKEERNDW